MVTFKDPPDPPPPLHWWTEGGVTGVYIDSDDLDDMFRYHPAVPLPRNVLRPDLEVD